MATPRSSESGSRRLSDSPSRGVSDSPISRVRGVADSPTRQVFLLNIQKPSRGVKDSPTHRVGESFFDYEYLREFEAKSGTARKVV